MKLYFSPGACSLASHIALLEGGLSFAAERVDLRAGKTASDADYNAINPKGYVPALTLDDGQLLTENVALLQYIADQAPEARLAPANGTMERFRLVEWLAFISTEVHKTFSPLFNPAQPDAAKDIARQNLARRFAFLDAALANRSFLTGNQFTVADSYLFTVLNWTVPCKLDLTPWPNLQAFHARVAARPAVRAAMVAEGLIKG